MSDANSSRETLRAAREVAGECKSITAGFRRARRAHWEKLAGPLLSEMLEGRQDAERLLEDPDPLVRIVAIEVLADQWKPDQNLARWCERMAFHDPDSRVRNIAIATLALCHRSSDNPQVGRILAVVVRDDRQAMKFRLAAYHGLFSLRGTRLEWKGVYSSPPSDFPFPEGVDWSFVDSFLDASRTSSPVDPLVAALPNLSAEELGALRLYRQGVEALAKGDYSKCIEDLDEAIALQPSAAGAYFTRGRAYIELNRLDEAIVDLSRAAELSPNRAQTLRERGRVYRLRGEVGLAEQDERDAAAIEGDLKR